MRDPRVDAYARLLVDRCLGVQPGWQVLLYSTPLARPLIEELVREIARRGAYALPRITFGAEVLVDRTWLSEAPLELVGELAPIERHAAEQMDAVIAVTAPENTRADSDTPAERITAAQRAAAPLVERIASHSMPWVVCQYPTPALAQEAGMSVRAFEDLLFGACLIDWDAETERMRRIADRLDAASELRVLAEGTDLTIGIEGRPARVSDGRNNMPDGEVFLSPLEDSAEGTVAFTEFPAERDGRELRGIRLRFEAGRVVDASADSAEDYLLELLDTDEGARRLGEVGIGCNPGVTRYLRNTLFDEKIDGTCHLALGKSFPDLGGLNESAIHWDVVKDLRNGGQLLLDGEVVQSSGRWSLSGAAAS